VDIHSIYQLYQFLHAFVERSAQINTMRERVDRH